MAFVLCFSVILGNHTRHVFSIAESSVGDGGDDGEDDYVDIGERGVDYLLPEDDVEEDVRTDLVNKIFPEGEIGVEENLVPGPEFQNCPAEDDFAVKCTTRTFALESDELFIECEFNTVDMLFRCSLELDSETKDIETEAYVNSDGSLGANIQLEGAEETPYYLNVYTHNTTELNKLLQQIDEFDGSYDAENLSTISSSVAQPMGWISKLFKLMPKIVVIVVVVYVIVAETAEQIKARYNYADNQQYEIDNNINLTYVDRQVKSVWAGYKFGFAKFDDAGCAVASVYNLKIDIGIPEMLSDVIYKFEQWGIEFSIGWGYLGSNSLDLWRYFKREKIKYTKYIISNSFFKAANKKNKIHFIMSRWNSTIGKGAHTFYVYKDLTQPYPFFAYNFNYNGNWDTKTIQELNNGAGFIVGYVIHV